MTTPAIGTVSATDLRHGGPSQDAQNRTEQLLAEHLLGRAIDRLTDRPGGTHPFPWEPSQRVRIGVLQPTIIAPEPESGDGGDGAAAPTTTVAPPIDNRGVIGLDFIVEGAADALELDLDVRFALYHPVQPPFAVTAAEARQAQAAAAANPRRRPTIRVNPSWERDDRHVTFTMTAPAGGRASEVTTDHLPQGGPAAADAASAVDAHYRRPDAVRKLKGSQTLPVAAALGSPADLQAALTNQQDPTWPPSAPKPRATITTSPAGPGLTAVSVSLTNALELTGPPHPQDLSVYDTRLVVTVRGPARLVPQRLRFSEDDVRYADVATVPGRGRGCVALPGPGPGQLKSETLPVHAQHVSAPTNHGADVRFTTLAAGFGPQLATIAAEMRAFLRSWDFSAAATPDDRAWLQSLHDQFEAETERFELGCDLLAQDAHLRQAFTLTNDTFDRASTASGRPDGAWRLFQLVFIVTELGAIAGREQPNDPRLRAELDAVDVLWFPTGGGKTEAYLGLITVALFYDRLRGKGRGTTAWLLFPLRMLSVQQLARVNHVLHHAEDVRQNNSISGDPYTLGYFVGSGNTPNRLHWNDSNSWWPGLDTFTTWSPSDRDARRLVGACPSCGDPDSVGLDGDTSAQRLVHVCRNCGHHLAIHASDEEVTRYQPSVVVSTVDKITAFSRNGELTSLNHGPRMRCPAHGWYSHARCVAHGCDTDPATHTPPSHFKDPTPALWVQDELHLVREDLGVFAGHYHTLLAELARGAGNEPPKVIAATATIEQYEDQLSQVYGRRPRMFPVGGPTLERSFYAERTDDIRRLYLGVMPSGGGTVKVDLAGELTCSFVRDVHDLTDDPASLITHFAAAGVTVTPADALRLLFDYELALAYVNSKAHGVQVHDEVHSLSDELASAGHDRIRSASLTGEVPLGELATVVADVQGATLATARENRVRALVGTSVISHGVDLDRLNFEVLAGMPPSYAHYIQATARAGRSRVGLVVSVFDRLNRRETSMYQSFATTHAALERMVEPVPVNRFAARAVNRTLPGIVCALLWDETRHPSHGTLEQVGRTRNFRPWWDSQGHALVPRLKDRVPAAYRCPVAGQVAQTDEARLTGEALHRWETIERQRMEQWQDDRLEGLFTSPAMTSLRDVDIPVDFSGGARSTQIVDRLAAGA